MATRFLNLSPDKRLEVPSFLSFAFFFLLLSVTLYISQNLGLVMLLVIIPIEFALSLFLFQRHSPIYWLRTFHFLTTESILNSSWDDNQTLHLSDVLDSEVYNSGNSLEDLDL